MLNFAYGVLLVAVLLVPAAVICSSGRADTPGAAVPEAAVDEALATSPGEQSVFLAGGCFWGVQIVFQHMKGVKQAISGYAGGSEASAHYDLVSTGSTGHAEAVKVTYDPSKITLGKLLRVFFAVVHDPTELNRQGPDDGSQYRSAIFYSSPEQKHIAESYVGQLGRTGLYRRPIVTQIAPLKAFYPAEDYHQNYATNHPTQPYIAYNDLPKLAHFREQFPELYVAK
jgi:peptide-methionine (S)-S-oxide reductase